MLLCYSSEWKGTLAAGSQEYNKVTPYNKPHTTNLTEVAASALERSSKELDRRQALVRVSWSRVAF